jgi:hypothetical protein
LGRIDSGAVGDGINIRRELWWSNYKRIYAVAARVLLQAGSRVWWLRIQELRATALDRFGLYIKHRISLDCVVVHNSPNVDEVVASIDP